MSIKEVCPCFSLTSSSPSSSSASKTNSSSSCQALYHQLYIRSHTMSYLLHLTSLKNLTMKLCRYAPPHLFKNQTYRILALLCTSWSPGRTSMRRSFGALETLPSSVKSCLSTPTNGRQGPAFEGSTFEDRQTKQGTQTTGLFDKWTSLHKFTAYCLAQTKLVWSSLRFTEPLPLARIQWNAVVLQFEFELKSVFGDWNDFKLEALRP